MKNLVFLFLAFLPLFSFSQFEDKRKAYLKAGAGEDGIRAFYADASTYSLSTPTDKAYKGVAVAMYASLAASVAEKFSVFSEGKKYIEEAVTADWYNPEIRFLRFSVQAEVPFVVGYSSDLKEDAYVVIDALENKKIDTSSAFWSTAIRFMLNSGELNNDQQIRLSKFSS